MKSSRNVELSEQNNKVKFRTIRARSQRARAQAPSMSFLFLSFNQGFIVFSKYQTKSQKETNQHQQAKQNNTRNASNLIHRLWFTNKDVGRCKPDLRKQRKNPVMTSSWKNIKIISDREAHQHIHNHTQTNFGQREAVGNR